ncbi:MAG: hypothetical protein WCX74_02730 [Candidatus Paceibacterota bacterium]
MIKKYFFLILSLFLIPISFVAAATFSSGEKVFMQGDAIEGNAFLAGNTVTVDNEIRGDLFAAGEKIFINGKINGDLICVAKEIIINGEVNGNVRCAFQEIRIRGNIERSVLGLGEKIHIEKDSSIGRDLIFAGAEATVDGTVKGSLDINSSSLAINGMVGQNVNYYSDEENSENTGLFINSGSNVNGNVNYNAFGQVKGDTAKSVLGTVNKYDPEIKNIRNDVKTNVIAQLGFLVSLILTTLALVLVGKNSLQKLVKRMVPSVWSSVGIGAICFFALPVIGIILLVTGIGAYLGIVCFLFWIIMLLLAIFFAGISFGELVNNKLFKGKIKNFALIAILGVLLGYILTLIPFLGFIIFIFGLWWGIGGIILAFAEKRKEISE